MSACARTQLALFLSFVCLASCSGKDSSKGEGDKNPAVTEGRTEVSAIYVAMRNKSGNFVLQTLKDNAWKQSDLFGGATGMGSIVDELASAVDSSGRLWLAANRAGDNKTMIYPDAAATGSAQIMTSKGYLAGLQAVGDDILVFQSDRSANQLRMTIRSATSDASTEIAFPLPESSWQAVNAAAAKDADGVWHVIFHHHAYTITSSSWSMETAAWYSYAKAGSQTGETAVRLAPADGPMACSRLAIKGDKELQLACATMRQDTGNHLDVSSLAKVRVGTKEAGDWSWHETGYEYPASEPFPSLAIVPRDDNSLVSGLAHANKKDQPWFLQGSADTWSDPFQKEAAAADRNYFMVDMQGQDKEVVTLVWRNSGENDKIVFDIISGISTFGVRGTTPTLGKKDLSIQTITFAL